MPPREGAPKAPKSKLPTNITTLVNPRVRRIAGIATAILVVTGTGASSAMFVDYLADRAKLRISTSTITRAPAREVKAPAAAEMKAVAKAAANKASQMKVVLPKGVATAKAATSAPAEVAEVALARTVTAEVPSAAVSSIAPSSAAELKAVVRTEPGAIEEDERVEKSAEADMEPLPIAALAPDEVSEPSGVLSAEAVVDDDMFTAAIPTPRPKAPEQPADSGRAAKVTAHVNLRARPADESKVLAVVPAKAAVSVLSCKSWCEVKYAGQKGWIYKRFIRS